MMLIAGRNGMAVKFPVTAKNYVQDGLYYQLDGIENAGIGTHSSMTTTWTDLTGNGRNATFINAASGLVWQNDAAYLYGKTHDGIAKIYGLPSMTAFTFEIVSRMDSKEYYARLFDTEAWGSGNRRFAGLFGTTASPTNMSFVCGVNADLDYDQIPVSTDARSISLTPTKNSSGVIGLAAYLNGVYKQTLFPPRSLSPATAPYIDVGNRSSPSNRGFDGAVFSIRVYSRLLTAAEIAANYAVDKIRFNLP